MGFSMHKTGRLHSTDGVAGRMRAQQLAPVDPAAALAVARVVADAWYRCQALSSVARVAPYEVATKAFREARAAAAQGADDYQRAAVLAFTIEAALERGWTALADEVLREALDRIRQVEPANSRAFALALLWVKGFAGGDEMRRQMIDCALAHCDPNRGWRSERLFRDMIERLYPEQGAALIDALRPGRTKERLARRYAGRTAS
jgi:hypothetical protein